MHSAGAHVTPACALHVTTQLSKDDSADIYFQAFDVHVNFCLRPFYITPAGKTGVTSTSALDHETPGSRMRGSVTAVDVIVSMCRCSEPRTRLPQQYGGVAARWLHAVDDQSRGWCLCMTIMSASLCAVCVARGGGIVCWRRKLVRRSEHNGTEWVTGAQRQSAAAAIGVAAARTPWYGLAARR